MNEENDRGGAVQETPAAQPEPQAPSRAAPEGSAVESAPAEGPAPPSPLDEGSKASRTGRWRAGLRRKPGKKVLAGIGIGVLALILAGAVFAAGYVVGDHEGHEGSRQVNLQRLQQLRQSAPRRGRELGGLRGLMRNGQGEVASGTVASVAQDSITVNTLTGSATFAITAQTRILGTGKPGIGQNAAGGLKAGQKVTVVSDKSQSGQIEAIVIAVQPGS
jgi:hypothetical protein